MKLVWKIPLFDGNWALVSQSGLSPKEDWVELNVNVLLRFRFEKPPSKCYQNCSFVSLSVQYREVHIAEKNASETGAFFHFGIGCFAINLFQYSGKLSIG